MRYLSIIFFLFVCHLSIAVYNATGVFDTGLQEHGGFINAVSKQELADESYVTSEVSTDSTLSFGDYIKALFYFVGIFGLGVLVVPYTLHSMMGMSWAYATLFALPVYFLYVVAWIQIISNSDYKAKK